MTGSELSSLRLVVEVGWRASICDGLCPASAASQQEFIILSFLFACFNGLPQQDTKSRYKQGTKKPLGPNSNKYSHSSCFRPGWVRETSACKEISSTAHTPFLPHTLCYFSHRGALKRQSTRWFNVVCIQPGSCCNSTAINLPKSAA